MPTINSNDMDAFFNGFSSRFNATKLAEAFPTAEEKAALADLSRKLGQAIQANQSDEKIWENIGTAKSVAIKLLKLAI